MGNMIESIYIFFIGSTLIVISLMMPMTFNLVKNLLEQTYFVKENKGTNKRQEGLAQNQKNTDAIIFYYYFVSFFMEAFVLYGVFAILFLLTILFEKIDVSFINTQILKNIWIIAYVLLLMFFISYEICRRKKGGRKNEHKGKHIVSIIVIAIPISFSIIIPIILQCSGLSLILSFILFSLVPFYLLCWVIIGWIWAPISRLVKLFNIESK